MADILTVLHAYDRILRACRPRRVADPAGGPAVSAHQAGILAFLDEDDPTMVGELADYMGVTASTMSLTLKRLEAAGYIRRDRDPADRRVTNVRLTEAGARVRSASSSLDVDRVDGVLRTLSPSQRAEALRGLVILADGADALIRRSREAVAAQVGGES